MVRTRPWAHIPYAHMYLQPTCTPVQFPFNAGTCSTRTKGHNYRKLNYTIIGLLHVGCPHARSHKGRNNCVPHTLFSDTITHNLCFPYWNHTHDYVYAACRRQEKVVVLLCINVITWERIISCRCGNEYSSACT